MSYFVWFCLIECVTKIAVDSFECFALSVGQVDSYMDLVFYFVLCKLCVKDLAFLILKYVSREEMF